MIVVRSTLFFILQSMLTVVFSFIALLTFPLPLIARYRIITLWSRLVVRLATAICGIRYRVIGRDNLPSSPSIVLAKHQSAWETLMLQEVFKYTVFVWKKEIKYIPFFGWALASIPMIETDRSATKAALKSLVDQGRDRLENGYTVIIFPEGTRSQPGSKNRYKGGGAHLAVETGTPVVPVALNSGEFWGRNALFKKCGTVTVSIGPAIDPAGLSSSEVLARAETWIEDEMRRISPTLYEAAS